MNDKAKNIQNMFNRISYRYDILNTVLSFGRDSIWRNKSVKLMKMKGCEKVLDLACGTGGMIRAIKRNHANCSVISADFSIQMLLQGKRKGLENLVTADACHLPFKDESFDAVTIAFGFRNVVEKEIALREIFRVLKNNSKLCVLEFSTPNSPLFGSIYKLYFSKILPRLAGILSDKKAYEYLPESVKNFPTKKDYKIMIENVGFTIENLKYHDFGICNSMIAKKNDYKF